MPFAIAKARRDTPGCNTVLHLNNAGSSLITRPVLDAELDYMHLESMIGGYESALQEQEKLEHFYTAAASLINCHPDEIAFMQNASRAWDMAFYAIPFQAGDRILTSMAEYASNHVAFLQIARRYGVIIEPIPDDAYGQISLQALREAIDERVRLISVTHIPTNGGLVNPVAEVGKIAREAGILYQVDACQSVGQLPIDVEEIGCDFLSATGRKYLRGPRGTGFLYVRKAIMDSLEPPMVDNHAAQHISKDSYQLRDDARRFESWETNLAGKIGLTAAIDYAQAWGIQTTWRRIKDLSYQLRARLSPLPGVIVHDRGIVQCGIVTFTIDGLDPVSIQRQLAAKHINITISEQSSTPLDMEARQLTQLLRASVHYYNTEEEIERFCATLASLLP